MHEVDSWTIAQCGVFVFIQLSKLAGPCQLNVTIDGEHIAVADTSVGGFTFICSTATGW